MESYCGCMCEECNLYKKKCKGCIETKGCPFNKKCFIASYIEIGGKKSFDELCGVLINEFNSLNIEGMPKIDKLYPLNGSFVNMAYKLPNGEVVKFINDDESYLGTRVVSEFDNKTYFGLLANMNFLLVCKYDEDGSNNELLIYKKR